MSRRTSIPSGYQLGQLWGSGFPTEFDAELRAFMAAALALHRALVAGGVPDIDAAALVTAFLTERFRLGSSARGLVAWLRNGLPAALGRRALELGALRRARPKVIALPAPARAPARGKKRAR